jgi:hypothetical protein
MNSSLAQALCVAEQWPVVLNTVFGNSACSLQYPSDEATLHIQTIAGRHYEYLGCEANVPGMNALYAVTEPTSDHSHYLSRRMQHFSARRMMSSGMLRLVALVRIDVSKEFCASIRVTRFGELGTTLAVTSNRRKQRRNTTFLRNVGSYKSHTA